MAILFILFFWTFCRSEGNTDLLQRLGSLENGMKTMQADNSYLNHSVITLQEENKRLKDRVVDLEDRNLRLNLRVSSLEENYGVGIVHAKRIPGSLPAYVAFHANLNSGTTINDNDLIRFDVIKTNLENAYDGSTGIFKPPTPGYYVFFIHFLLMQDKSIEAEIVKNGANIQHIYAGASDSGYGPGSNMVIVQLNDGDQVWVRVHDKYHSAGAILDGPWCTFAGFLLYPTI